MAHGAGFQQRFALRQGCLARGRVFARLGERAQRKRAEERRPGLPADLYRLFRVGRASARRPATRWSSARNTNASVSKRPGRKPSRRHARITGKRGCCWYCFRIRASGMTGAAWRAVIGINPIITWRIDEV